MQRIVAETCEDAAAEEFLMLGPIQMVHCLPGPFMDSHVPLGNPCGFFGGWSNVVVQSLGGSAGWESNHRSPLKATKEGSKSDVEQQWGDQL